MYMYISVFDKFVWLTIGPQSLLIWHSTLLSFSQMAQLIVTNCLLIVFPMAHTLIIAEPIGPCFKSYQKLWCTWIFFCKFHLWSCQSTCTVHVNRVVETLRQLLSLYPYTCTLYSVQFQLTGHSLHYFIVVLHDWLFPHHCISDFLISFEA